MKDHTLVSSAKGFGYEICYTDYYLSEDGCIVCVMQELDGRDTENRIYLLIVEDRVVAADGSFAIAAPDSKLSAETVGLMDILFSEKIILTRNIKKAERCRGKTGSCPLSVIPMRFILMRTDAFIMCRSVR